MKSDVQLNLRAKESQRALIDAAAEILHKSRTDFIWRWPARLRRM
jgi:uncharacterized protein (DUF1778 family)